MSNHIAARFSVRLDPNDISKTHSFPDNRVHFIAPEYEIERLVRQQVHTLFSCFQALYTKNDISYHIAARFSVCLDPNDISQTYSFPDNRVHFFAPECETERLVRQQVNTLFSSFQALYTKNDMSYHIAARFSVRLDPNDISQTHSSRDKRVHFIAPEYENTRLVRFASEHAFLLFTNKLHRN